MENFQDIDETGNLECCEEASTSRVMSVKIKSPSSNLVNNKGNIKAGK
eukprot:CAMPEP_0197009472 /NCGR_PEP_ID=MMETSP1380-20130617/50298_1 /TAXON_ID=5936 /ORGANISM="Euplotes crassus, Strain CT5" /LENGTH=47 /DNA_ID= /DNA_START= /DNA_END= /DNA_ORIENTATION=